jgi:hypothetical protein
LLNSHEFGNLCALKIQNMSNPSIDISKLIRESRETLLNPKGYFSSMPLEGGFTEPVIKAAIYGTVAGVFGLLWHLTGLSAVGGSLWGGTAGIMVLIWSVVGAIVGVFIAGALMLVVSAICGGNTDYEANVRVAASLMVVYPINVFLSFFYGISMILGGLVGLLVSFYSIYLLYTAAIQALKGKESSARIVAIVLLVLSLLGFIGGQRANKAVRDISDIIRQEQLD